MSSYAIVSPAGVREIGWRGGFTREFGTADGQRVVVAALTRQQFADLADAARLARTGAANLMLTGRCAR